MNTTTAVLAPQLSFDDASELHSLLEAAGFAAVTVTAHSYTVRELYAPHLITRILSSVAAFSSYFTVMGTEERATLAQAVESKIGPALEKFVEGAEQLYPTSTHIVLVRKL